MEDVGGASAATQAIGAPTPYGDRGVGAEQARFYGDLAMGIPSAMRHSHPLGDYQGGPGFQGAYYQQSPGRITMDAHSSGRDSASSGDQETTEQMLLAASRRFPRELDTAPTIHSRQFAPYNQQLAPFGDRRAASGFSRSYDGYFSRGCDTEPAPYNQQFAPFGDRRAVSGFPGSCDRQFSGGFHTGAWGLGFGSAEEQASLAQQPTNSFSRNNIPDIRSGRNGDHARAPVHLGTGPGPAYQRYYGPHPIKGWPPYEMYMVNAPEPVVHDLPGGGRRLEPQLLSMPTLGGELFVTPIPPPVHPGDPSNNPGDGQPRPWQPTPPRIRSYAPSRQVLAPIPEESPILPQTYNRGQQPTPEQPLSSGLPPAFDQQLALGQQPTSGQQLTSPTFGPHHSLFSEPYTFPPQGAFETSPQLQQQQQYPGLAAQPQPPYLGRQSAAFVQYPSPVVQHVTCPRRFSEVPQAQPDALDDLLQQITARPLSLAPLPYIHAQAHPSESGAHIPITFRLSPTPPSHFQPRPQAEPFFPPGYVHPQTRSGPASESRSFSESDRPFSHSHPVPPSSEHQSSRPPLQPSGPNAHHEDLYKVATPGAISAKAKPKDEISIKVESETEFPTLKEAMESSGSTRKERREQQRKGRKQQVKWADIASQPPSPQKQNEGATASSGRMTFRPSRPGSSSGSASKQPAGSSKPPNKYADNTAIAGPSGLTSAFSRASISTPGPGNATSVKEPITEGYPRSLVAWRFDAPDEPEKPYVKGWESKPIIPFKRDPNLRSWLTSTEGGSNVDYWKNQKALADKAEAEMKAMARTFGITQAGGQREITQDPGDPSDGFAWSKIWMSEEEQQRARFERIRENMSFSGDNKSPFVPQDLPSYLKLKEDMRLAEQNRVAKNVAERQRDHENHHRFVQAGGDIEPDEAFTAYAQRLARRLLQSSALGRPSPFFHPLNDPENPSAAWPSTVEFKAHGDDMARQGRARGLPPPRVPVGPNVPYEQRKVIRSQPVNDGLTEFEIARLQEKTEEIKFEELPRAIQETLIRLWRDQ
ncbi:hypothetical protein F4778DRAFT_782837 [Xylariomycetidae sp. FL2044]|nr:hypothetical protein F4778DRAFT_782837 [Xylariomycetidae sp. FL2044]